MMIEYNEYNTIEEERESPTINEPERKICIKKFDLISEDQK